MLVIVIFVASNVVAIFTRKFVCDILRHFCSKGFPKDFLFPNLISYCTLIQKPFAQERVNDFTPDYSVLATFCDFFAIFISKSFPRTITRYFLHDSTKQFISISDVRNTSCANVCDFLRFLHFLHFHLPDHPRGDGKSDGNKPNRQFSAFRCRLVRVVFLEVFVQQIFQLLKFGQK